jgi:hypothetical protein
MRVNANDQLDLKGSCITGCTSNDILTYSYSLFIFDLFTNGWKLFTNNNYFYQTGKTKSELRLTKELFSIFSSQKIWKIDLVLNVTDSNLKNTRQAQASFFIYVNQPPWSGYCDIKPKTGTTNTLFNINCADWEDPDGNLVVNYAFYGEKKF